MGGGLQRVARVGGAHGLTPCSRAEALRTLAPSTLANLSSNPAQSFRVLGDLVSSVPTFTLSLGDDLGQARSELEGLLKSLNGEALLAKLRSV